MPQPAKISFMEVVWILVASIAFGIGLRNTFSAGFNKSLPMFGIAVFAFLIFLLRRYYRINSNNRN